MYVLSHSDPKSNLKRISLIVLMKHLKKKVTREQKLMTGISSGVRRSTSMIYIKRDYKIIRKSITSVIFTSFAAKICSFAI